jgi:hypothetical protein
MKKEIVDQIKMLLDEQDVTAIAGDARMAPPRPYARRDGE